MQSVTVDRAGWRRVQPDSWNRLSGHCLSSSFLLFASLSVAYCPHPAMLLHGYRTQAAVTISERLQSKRRKDASHTLTCDALSLGEAELWLWSEVG